jgi:TatD DNase family protein
LLVDTHCHLDFESFDDDREAVLARAQEAGVLRMINPGVDLASSQAALRLAERYPGVYAAVGVHPNDAAGWDDASLEELRALAGRDKVVAIGEIGLDYYRDTTPRDLQKRIFKEQLDLAAEMGLPVIIHNREATDDLLEILEDWHNKLENSSLALSARPGVLHSYSGDATQARRAISLGFRIGFTGPVTFRNAPDLQEVAAELSLENLLVETDAPFLAPHPKRGRRNEPANVRLIAEKLAELHGESIEAVAQITTANAGQLFLW